MGQIIEIKELKSYKEGIKNFNILFGAKTLGIFSRKNAREFIKKDYFYKIISNFKGKGCFFLFYSVTLSVQKCSEVTTPENIKEALLLASSASLISQELPCSDRNFAEHYGKEIHLLSFKDDKIVNVKCVFELIDSGTVWFYFMCGDGLDKDKLFFEIKNFQQNNCLNEENLSNLCSEIIKYQSKDRFTDELKIVSCRFNKEQIKEIFIKSVGKEKIEVIAKW